MGDETPLIIYQGLQVRNPRFPTTDFFKIDINLVIIQLFMYYNQTAQIVPIIMDYFGIITPSTLVLEHLTNIEDLFKS